MPTINGGVLTRLKKYIMTLNYLYNFKKNKIATVKITITLSYVSSNFF